ncbi:MAG: phenylalanine--tRNA ligase subunit beta [Patescibacteria group bacterium]|nr:phenylalanine--tRNA ligase subunit beta [Patescibacteria group bacterium]
MKFSYSLLKEFVPALPAKKKLAEELNLKSFETEIAGGDVLDISLPANRYSDAASHWGVAKEVSAIFGIKLNTPKGMGEIINLPEKNGLIGIKIEEPLLCPRYKAVLVTLDKKASSPAWIKKYLVSCGLRPISLVVDVMNYAMLETGQPLHAFDYDKLSARENKKTIIVRHALKNEKIETLDGKAFNLEKDDLVIADSSGALAIAGIKGGKKAEIDSSTKRIVIESANFDSSSVYSTSRRLNLLTDAAVRFSRNLSPALAEYGMNRAITLLKELARARVADSAEYYPKLESREIIGFSVSKLESLLGASVGKNEIVSILKKLGMNILPAKKTAFDFLVEPPAVRMDIETFEDLAEEVGRIYGYDRIKPKAPVVAIKPAEFDEFVIAKDRCRDFLLNLGFNEIYSYSFTDKPTSQWIWSSFKKDRTLIELQNPIAEDKKYLRGELTGRVLEAIKDNSRSFDEVRVFEIGKVFSEGGEKGRLAIGFGSKTGSFTAVKGVVDRLLRSFGITDIFFRPDGTETVLVESDHNVIGQIVIKDNNRRSVAELDLDEVKTLSLEEFEYRPLPKYPSIVRDLSVEFGDIVAVGEVLDVINQAKAPHLWDVDVADYYDQRHITLRFVFQADDRTLKDSEVDDEMFIIIEKLKNEFSLTVR